MRRILATLGVVILLSCASAPPPTPIEPILPVSPPSAWQGGGGPGEYADSALWWKDFGDAKLNTYVLQALGRHPRLFEAESRIRAAAATARAAGADLLPHLSAGATGGRGKSYVGGSLPGAPNTVTQDAYGVSLNIRWEIDLWGRIRSGQQAALADVEQARALKNAVGLSLAAQTAKAYFATIEAKQQVAVAKADVKSARELGKTISDRFGKGIGSALEVRFAESEVAAAESRLAAREQALDAAKRQLETLTADYPYATVETAAKLPAVPGPVPAGLPAGILSRRPDLIAAERAVAAAGARVDEARAALYPRISLTGSGGLASRDVSDILSGDFGVWTFAANLAAPLFEGGRLRARVDLTQATKEGAEASFALTVLEAFREVETSLAAEAFLARRSKALGDLVESARKSMELSEERYLSGVADILNVLEARRRFYSAESELLSHELARLVNRVDVHVALGGGFGSGVPTGE